MQQNTLLYNKECTVWGEDRNHVRLGHDVKNKAAIPPRPTRRLDFE